MRWRRNKPAVTSAVGFFASPMFAPCPADPFERAQLQHNFASLRSGYHNSESNPEFQVQGSGDKSHSEELDSALAW